MVEVRNGKVEWYHSYFQHSLSNWRVPMMVSGHAAKSISVRGLVYPSVTTSLEGWYSSRIWWFVGMLRDPKVLEVEHLELAAPPWAVLLGMYGASLW